MSDGRDTIKIPKTVLAHASRAGERELRALLCAYSGALPADVGLTDADMDSARRFWARRDMPLPDSDAAMPSTDIPQYDAQAIVSDINSRTELKFMLDKVQRLLGRTLSAGEINTLYGFFNWLGLPTDVILVLVEHCVNRGKTGIKYIEKVAAEWSREGISTFEQAESRVKAEKKSDEYERTLLTLLKLERPLSISERVHAGRWCSLGIAHELILRAYDITVKNTGKLSFAYMNSILISWHEKGIRSVKDIENKEPKRSAQRGEGRSAGAKGKKTAADYSAYEQWSRDYIKNYIKKEEE